MRSLVAFFLITFAVSWSIWLGTNALLSSEPSAILTSVSGLFLLAGTIAPSLVALAVTARTEGHAGLSALLSRLTLLPAGARWYVFAAGFMPTIKLAVVVLHRVITGAWPTTMGSTPWYVMALATLVSTPVQAGEEIGWRGFALPRLASRVGLAGASVILGIIWACWHLPLFFIPGGNVGESFPTYVLGVTAISVAMAWLYWRTNGSLLLTMLMHAAINNTASIVHAPAAVPFALRPSLIGGLTGALLWVPAAYFLLRMRAAGSHPAFSMCTR